MMSRAMRALMCAWMMVWVAGATAAERAKAPAAGDAVVDLELKNLSGKDVKTGDVRKGKVLVMEVGLTTCGWSNLQIAAMNRVAKEYGEKAAVVGVYTGEPAAKVKDNNVRRGVTYLTLLDADGTAQARYVMRSTPLVIVASAEGKIAYRGNYTEYAKLKEVIDGLVKGAGK